MLNTMVGVDVIIIITTVVGVDITLVGLEGLSLVDLEEVLEAVLA
jgi:hypothetical protein